MQAILESVARIEAQAYRLLAEQGATPVSRVLTAGARMLGQCAGEGRAASTDDGLHQHLAAPAHHLHPRSPTPPACLVICSLSLRRRR